MALRASLAQRKPPTTEFSLRVYDDRRARAELAAALAEGNPQRMTEAQAAVNACYERLIITAIPPVDWEGLVAGHPPTDQQRANGGWCNSDTFAPALLAVCVEGDETEADWADAITKGGMSQGEATALVQAVYDINLRILDPDLPKDSTPTRN